jgi:hypothetical protein
MVCDRHMPVCTQSVALTKGAGFIRDRYMA